MITNMCDFFFFKFICWFLVDDVPKYSSDEFRELSIVFLEGNPGITYLLVWCISKGVYSPTDLGRDDTSATHSPSRRNGMTSPFMEMSNSGYTINTTWKENNQKEMLVFDENHITCWQTTCREIFDFLCTTQLIVKLKFYLFRFHSLKWLEKTI